jgi:protocatechuate 3,4-dioxygenase alpha subunit
VAAAAAAADPACASVSWCPAGVFFGPHLSLWLVARGINIRLNTGIFFPQDAVLHETDPAQHSIKPTTRRSTLIAAQKGPATCCIDIRLQGPGETVFIEV